MSFKTVALSAMTATAMAGATALTASPALAANLAPGSFILDGQSSVTGFTKSTNPFTLNFQDMLLTSPKGNLSGLTGTPIVGSLQLKNDGSQFNITSGLTNFISGLFLGAEEVFLDLDATSYLTGSINKDFYSFAGALGGTLRTADNSKVADITLGAFKVTNGVAPGLNRAQIGVGTEVPTPALLPGLLGMGVAALRKRKDEAVELEEAKV